MLIVDNDDEMIIFTKNMFNSRFDMKYMRLTDVLLGNKIHKNCWIYAPKAI